MKIYISEPDGPYGCELDTGVMDVKLCDVYNGVKLKTRGLRHNEVLSISMRDNGFEIHYTMTDENEEDEAPIETDLGWFEFKDGEITGPVQRP